MALNTQYAEQWSEKYKSVVDRTTKIEDKLNSIFSNSKYSSYVIDSDDLEAKAASVATSLTDEKEKAKFKKDFKAAMNELQASKKSIEQDFREITKYCLQAMENLDIELKESEELLKQQKLEKEKLDNELEELEKEQKAIIAKITSANVSISTISEDMENIEKERVKLREEIEDIKNKRQELQDKLINATPKEQKSIVKKMNGLTNSLGPKEKELKGLDEKYDYLSNEKIGFETDISELNTSLDNNKVSINNKKIEIDDKQKRIEEADKTISEDRNQYTRLKENYSEKFKETQEKLKDKGIDVVFEEPETSEVGDDEELETKEAGNDNKPERQKGNNGAFYGGTAPQKEEEETAIAPTNKKDVALSYIKGYAGSVAGLTPKDRLDKVKGELLSKNYKQMVEAYNDLSSSDVTLTKQDKKDLKRIMDEDKKALYDEIKDLRQDEFRSMLEDIGYEPKKGREDILYKNLVGVDNSPIMEGFNSLISKEGIEDYSDMLTSYYESKDNLSEEQIANVEKYLITPIKMGTLQEQINGLSKNGLSKFFSAKKSSRVGNLRNTIIQYETGKDVEKQVSDSNAFSRLGLGNLVEDPSKGYTSRGKSKQTPPPVK